MTDLQVFVTKFFDTLGAAVEEVEYSLIYVIIPEEYNDVFGKTELKLCFDYEVYLENPDYEFVTFGSFILDKIINLSFEYSRASIRYVLVDNLNVIEPEKKIKDFLSKDRCNIEIIEQYKVINYFARYSFKVNYISDNAVEEFENIVIDMNNLCISNNFSKILNNIFYETKPKYDYPLNCSVDFLEGFKKAVKQIESISKLKANNFVNTSVKDKETERINEYYQSLKIEAEKRMKRKNLSQEKINEYKHKIKLYDIEKDRQLNEIIERYNVKSEIIFQNTVVYAVPVIYFKYKLTSRNESDGKLGSCYFNKITKTWQSARWL
ncbi:hypothetical protein D9O40_02410 [Clostridium autoethanogenum]|uniref:Uncharacterized protein n=1 Tax=Clostridium autoethanogenum TaxID=84023 RepID=A0A3M0T102_9CLOT|nr:hypothetical protein [Clostridium autoethanogenum]RMD04319.1 hypothetical protein D9O40_02410 [Clostridium autoethanogenum]